VRVMDTAGIFPSLLNRDVNMVKYLAGSKTVGRIKKKPLEEGNVE
jgi:hypothetical protein